MSRIRRGRGRSLEGGGVSGVGGVYKEQRVRRPRSRGISTPRTKDCPWGPRDLRAPACEVRKCALDLLQACRRLHEAVTNLWLGCGNFRFAGHSTKIAVGSPIMQLVNPAGPFTEGRRCAPTRIEMGSGELPVWVTRVVFLIGNKFVLAVFRRDGLEARRAD